MADNLTIPYTAFFAPAQVRQIGVYFMLIRAINAEIVRRRYKPLINNIKNENTVT